MKTINEIARSMVQLVIETLRAIVQSLRYILGGATQDREKKMDAHLAKRDDERERESIDTAALLREAGRLDAATKAKQVTHARAAQAKRTAQTHIGIFKISAIRLDMSRNAVYMHITSAGCVYQWRAPIDELGKLVVDESMPLTLLNAINSSPDPTDAMTCLAALVQAEVDRLMLQRHEDAKWRLENSSGIVQIHPNFRKLNWINK